MIYLVRHGQTNWNNDILKTYSGENIFVVTHAGVSIYARCYFGEKNMDEDYNKYILKKL